MVDPAAAAPSLQVAAAVPVVASLLTVARADDWALDGLALGVDLDSFEVAQVAVRDDLDSSAVLAGRVVVHDDHGSSEEACSVEVAHSCSEEGGLDSFWEAYFPAAYLAEAPLVAPYCALPAC